MNWDQDAHNLFSLALHTMQRKNFRACNGLPFITSSASGPCHCCFHTVLTIVVFFCLRSSASFRTWWSSCHFWQYNPYSDKATKRDYNNHQQLFDTANKQTYKTTKYQSSSWFSEENESVATPLLRNCVHSYERNSTEASHHLFEEHNLLITRRSFLSAQGFYVDVWNTLFPKALIIKFQLLQTLYHKLDKVKEYDVAKSNINGNTKR